MKSTVLICCASKYFKACYHIVECFQLVKIASSLHEVEVDAAAEVSGKLYQINLMSAQLEVNHINVSLSLSLSLFLCE